MPARRGLCAAALAYRPRYGRLAEPAALPRGAQAPMLSIEPDLLHAPAVEHAVVHQGEPLDLGPPAGRLAHEEDNRPNRILGQFALNLPNQLLAFGSIALR